MRDGEVLTEEKIESYIALLSDLPEESLLVGLKRATRECTWFPAVAEIRERCVGQELLAEQAWEVLQRVLSKHWHPDIGFHSNPPTLDAATEYAIRQCGGKPRIWNATDKDFGFIRKQFLESHQRFNAEGGEQTRMSQQLAESTLQQIQEAQQKQLAVGNEPEAPQPAPESEPKPMKEPQSFEEYQKRMALLKQQRERLGDAS